MSSRLLRGCIVASMVLEITYAQTMRPSKPHILLVLADDLGFGNVGWNRDQSPSPSKEVQTPQLDALVADGIQMTRFYVYHMCSPTRSALQSGRLPMHVNLVNADPTIYNASESSGTGAGIPRNITGIATKLKAAGYKTHMAGKWDAGMATPTHTPAGRGYDSALSYFHHGNNYWTEEAGDLTCSVAVDLYDTHGPAHGLNGSKKIDTYNVSDHEDVKFLNRLLPIIDAHDPATPLFMFYAAHLVHAPYQVPQQYLDKLSRVVDNSTSEANMRLTYAAMVNLLDDVVGNLTAAFKAKGMWDDTLMIFFSDNGGPIYAGGNNYPLRGGKYSEFEGGVRVAAFASGGMIPQKYRGTQHAGLGSVADIYTTLCGIAGVDARDHLAEAAGLPLVDGLDLSKMLLDGAASPRTEVPLLPLKPNDLKLWEQYENYTKKPPMCWKVQQCDLLDADLKVKKHVTLDDCCTLCNATAGCAASVWSLADMGWGFNKVGTCTLKKSSNKQVVEYEPESTCFLKGSSPMPAPIIHSQAGIVVGDLKLITGKVSQTVWTGHAFPNHSTPWTSNTTVKVPDFVCASPYKIGCLFNVSADPTEHEDLAESRPEDAKRLFDRLREVSKTRFDPMRGDGDERACKQVEKNGNFFGPWLELEAQILV